MTSSTGLNEERIQHHRRPQKIATPAHPLPPQAGQVTQVRVDSQDRVPPQLQVAQANRRQARTVGRPAVVFSCQMPVSCSKISKVNWKGFLTNNGTPASTTNGVPGDR